MSAAQAPPAMTSRERVLAALRREPVDRTPLVNPTSVATVELMDLVDAPFPDANREPELMARLAATGHTELGFDSIMPVFSIIQESSALGCKIQWEQKDNWPTVKMTRADLRDARRHPDPGRPAGASRHAVRARGHQHPAQAIRRRGRDHRQDHGPVVARLPHVRRRAVPAHVARRSRPRPSSCLDSSRRSTIAVRHGADRGRRRRAHAARSCDRRPRRGEYYRRYLRDMHIEFAEELPMPDHPAHLRPHGGPDGLHRRDRHGGLPLRLQERAGRVDGRRSTARISLVGNINNPETLYSKGPEEVRRRGSQEPRAGRPDGRAGVRDPAADPDRKPAGDPRGRRRLAWRADRCSRRGATWPSSATSPTTSSGRRSRSSSSGPDERERHRSSCSRGAAPTLQEIAAALIDGDNDTVDELTRGALDEGIDGARGDGRRADRGHGASSASSSARTSSSSRKCWPAPAP